MKKLLFLLALLGGVSAMVAQSDTIRYLDPWYAFHKRSSKLQRQHDWNLNYYTQPGLMAIRHWDTVPLKVYGVAMTGRIESKKGAYGTDSVMYMYIGRTADSLKPWGKYHYSPDGWQQYNLLEVKKLFLTGNELILPESIRQLYFEHCFMDTSIVSTCFEFYFDSIYDYAAGDTILVGGDFNIIANFKATIEYGVAVDDLNFEAQHNSDFYEYDEEGVVHRIFDIWSQQFFEPGAPPAIFFAGSKNKYLKFDKLFFSQFFFQKVT